jgi:hypothetical protein
LRKFETLKTTLEMAIMQRDNNNAALLEAQTENERLKIERRSYLAVERGCRALAAMVIAPSDADLEAIVGCLVSLGLIRCTDGSDTERECDAGDARTILTAIADRARAPEREGDEK